MVLLRLFSFKQSYFTDRLQAEHSILSSKSTAAAYTKCTDPVTKPLYTPSITGDLVIPDTFTNTHKNTLKKSNQIILKQ